jgi:hypothetical protein
VTAKVCLQTRQEQQQQRPHQLISQGLGGALLSVETAVISNTQLQQHLESMHTVVPAESCSVKMRHHQLLLPHLLQLSTHAHTYISPALAAGVYTPTAAPAATQHSSHQLHLPLLLLLLLHQLPLTP